MDAEDAAIVVAATTALWVVTMATSHRDDDEGEFGDDAQVIDLLICDAMMCEAKPRVGYGHYLPSDDLFTNLSQTPSLFKAFTNFHVPEFEELFTLVSPFIDMPVDIRGNRRVAHLQGQPRIVSANGRRVGRPPKLSLRTRFMIFLAVLRDGLSLIDQIVISGQNQQGLSDDFYHMVFGVLEGLSSEIAWPSAVERQQLEGSFWGDFSAAGLLTPINIWDGVIQPIETPAGSADEPIFFCSRKQKHGFN